MLAKKEANILEIELWDRDYMQYLITMAHNFIITNMDNENKEESLTSEDSIENVDIDPFLMDAIDMVVETKQASTSLIQRRFKVGYARAERILDQMEERGIISEDKGNIQRKVLMNKEKWQELRQK